MLTSFERKQNREAMKQPDGPLKRIKRNPLDLDEVRHLELEGEYERQQVAVALLRAASREQGVE